MKHAKIAVGMERRRAAGLLRSAGARVTKIDGAGPPRSDARHGGVAYKTATGGLLIVDYERHSSAAHFHVAGLSLCSNPDAPKAQRVWRNSKQLAI